MTSRKITDSQWEKFFTLVYENPPLYDSSCEGHSDLILTNNIWSKISEQMNMEDIDGPSWKNLWKNKRDTYIKKRRVVTVSGQAASSKAPWKFMGALYFLAPHANRN